MKSISSQLNRGTELLKQTVQRAIFSSASSTKVPVVLVDQQLSTAAKPTPYHSDPHAVTRSCSVDSIHQEMCYIRPIRPYSLTPFRRGSLLNCPVVVAQPDKDGLVIKFTPLKVKARFKLQKGTDGSAFCSWAGGGHEETAIRVSPGKVKNSPVKSSQGRGTKRKRSAQDEEEDPEEDLFGALVPKDEIVPKASVGKNKKATAAAERKKTNNNNTNNNKNNKIEIKKRETKASKRKSLEQEKQEREDFELAKRLQKELNSSNEADLGPDGTASNGTVGVRRTRNGRSLNNVSVTTSYSLRTTRSLSKVSVASVSPPANEPVKEDHGENKDQEIQTKRKKNSPPKTKAKNGLKTKPTRNKNTKNNNNITKKSGIPLLVEEEEDVEPPQPMEIANKRTTRSKGSIRSTQ